MDDQTRMAHFESMRRGPGMRTRVNNKNKKLFMKHKELEKTCCREVLRHQFDTKLITAELRQQQLLVAAHRRRLERQKDRAALQREKTHLVLERQERGHLESSAGGGLSSSSSSAPPASSRVAMSDDDMVKAISGLQMPSAMKERLIRTQLYASYSTGGGAS